MASVEDTHHHSSSASSSSSVEEDSLPSPSSRHLSHPPAEPTEKDQIKEKVKRKAWETLCHIHKEYKKLKLAILEQKEKEIEQLTNAIQDEKHADYLKEMEKLAKEKEKSGQIALLRKQKMIQLIHEQYEAERKQLERQFLYQRQALKQKKFQQLFRKQNQLKAESQEKERLRLGLRIQQMKTIWKPVKQKRNYSLKQYAWQSKENQIVLSAYQMQKDDLGYKIPPRLTPFGLSDREVEQDLDVLRNADTLLQNLKWLKPALQLEPVAVHAPLVVTQAIDKQEAALKEFTEMKPTDFTAPLIKEKEKENFSLLMNPMI